ncbi:hypothetical protein IFM89_020381, partial [Coptis chinensis]
IDMVGLKYFTDEDFNALNIPCLSSSLVTKVLSALRFEFWEKGFLTKIILSKRPFIHPSTLCNSLKVTPWLRCNTGSSKKEGHSLSVKVLHLSVKNGRLGTSTVDMPPCQSYLELDFKQIQNHSKLSKPQRSMCEREELPLITGTAFNTGKVPCVAYANKVETTTGADAPFWAAHMREQTRQDEKRWNSKFTRLGLLRLGFSLYSHCCMVKTQTTSTSDRAAFAKLDIETGRMVSEWNFEKKWHDISNSKGSQLDHSVSTFLGLDNNRLCRWDSNSKRS